jgi:hypothetical protein
MVTLYLVFSFTANAGAGIEPSVRTRDMANQVAV